MVAAVGAAAAVGGAAISANASGKAADAQSAAAGQATGLSRDQYYRTRADYEPYRNTGVLGNALLGNYLGLPGHESSKALTNIEGYIQKTAGEQYDSGRTQKKFPGISREKIVQGALDNYRAGLYGDGADALQNFTKAALGRDYVAPTPSEQDNANFGSLLKPFSEDELNADPIYQNTFQFALDNGNKAINQQAAATGGILNGNVIKAMSRFGANTAATYGNDAFNRDSATKTRIYNSLAGVSGAGQQAVGQVSASGQNYANVAGNNITGAATARGASAIANANSLNNALGTGFNAYQQQNLLNNYRNNSAFDNANGYDSQMAYMNSQY